MLRVRFFGFDGQELTTVKHGHKYQQKLERRIEGGKEVDCFLYRARGFKEVMVEVKSKEVSMADYYSMKNLVNEMTEPVTYDVGRSQPIRHGLEDGDGVSFDWN